MPGLLRRSPLRSLRAAQESQVAGSMMAEEVRSFVVDPAKFHDGAAIPDMDPIPTPVDRYYDVYVTGRMGPDIPGLDLLNSISPTLGQMSGGAFLDITGPPNETFDGMGGPRTSFAWANYTTQNWTSGWKSQEPLIPALIVPVEMTEPFRIEIARFVVQPY